MDTPSLRVAHLLNNVTNDIRRSADEVLEGTGICDLQWAILAELRRASKSHDPVCTIGGVADAIGRHQDTVSREVSKLADRKLVRVDADTDELASVITLTSRAERLLPALTISMAALAEQATNGLTNDELAVLESMLRTIVKNLA